MPKFKRVSEEVDAVQFVDGRYGEAIDFCPQLMVDFAPAESNRVGIPGRTVRAAILQAPAGGGSHWNVGQSQWIVRDSDGTFSVLPDATFRKLYQPV